jgi:putative solute:sodium symporter small subunit
MSAKSNTDETQETSQADNQKRYWQSNLRLLGILADWLDQFSIFGFKLGFWFAQQGAIYVFVVLIFVYARQMKSLDRKFGVGDDKDPEEESQL